MADKDEFPQERCFENNNHNCCVGNQSNDTQHNHEENSNGLLELGHSKSIMSMSRVNPSSVYHHSEEVYF